MCVKFEFNDKLLNIQKLILIKGYDLNLPISILYF